MVTQGMKRQLLSVMSFTYDTHGIAYAESCLKEYTITMEHLTSPATMPQSEMPATTTRRHLLEAVSPRCAFTYVVR
jgi:hypothetical protein